MKKLILLAAALFIPLAVIAEEAVVKRHVIVSVDGDHDERIEKIIQQAEDMAGEDGNVHVMVKRLEDGEIEVEKTVMSHGDLPHLAPRAGHASMMMGKGPGMPKMSRGAAECVLKNIRHAATDAAAMAVVRACTVLNPKTAEPR